MYKLIYIHPSKNHHIQTNSFSLNFHKVWHLLIYGSYKLYIQKLKSFYLAHHQREIYDHDICIKRWPTNGSERTFCTILPLHWWGLRHEMERNAQSAMINMAGYFRDYHRTTAQWQCEVLQNATNRLKCHRLTIYSSEKLSRYIILAAGIDKWGIMLDN